MCVVAVSDKVRLTPEMVEKMYQANSAGGGVAWREGEPGSAKVMVHWKKGLSLEEMLDLCKRLPLPFVAHFRIPTVGGPVPELCHPFPVSRETSLELEGVTSGYVLFHNGHWGRWKETSMELALKVPGGLPQGRWSDTRAMAWTAGVLGPGVLDFIDEKTIIFGPYDTEVTGNGWSRVEEVIVSNTSWNYSRITHHARRIDSDFHSRESRGNGVDPRLPQKYRDGVLIPSDGVKALPPKWDPSTEADNSKGKAGGTSQPVSFPGDSTDADSGGDQSQQVEEAETSTSPVAKEAGQEGSKDESSAGSDETRGNGSLRDTSAAMRRWACSINAKRFSHTGGKVVVIDDEETGRIRIGTINRGFNPNSVD